jgi:hypothetical protein
MGVFVFLVRKNPAKAKKIFVSFFSVEVLISIQLLFAGIDIYTGVLL